MSDPEPNVRRPCFPQGSSTTPICATSMLDAFNANPARTIVGVSDLVMIASSLDFLLQLMFSILIPLISQLLFLAITLLYGPSDVVPCRLL